MIIETDDIAVRRHCTDYPIVNLIEDLDFEPACERTNSCPAGNPVATHVVYFFHRPCYPPVQLICTPCADRLRKWREPMKPRCTYCGGLISEWLKDLLEVRPLP